MSSLKRLTLKWSIKKCLHFCRASCDACGFEIRDEVVSDDRDDRFDGTIDYCDYENDCYPLVAMWLIQAHQAM